MARFFAVVIAFAAISSAGAASTCMRGEIAPTAGFCQGNIVNMRRCAADYGSFQSALLEMKETYDLYTDPGSLTTPMFTSVSCEETVSSGCAAANVTTKTGTEACLYICNGIADCTTDAECSSGDAIPFKAPCCSKCEEAHAAGCNGPETGRDNLTQANVTDAISAVRAPASARCIDRMFFLPMQQTRVAFCVPPCIYSPPDPKLEQGIEMEGERVGVVGGGVPQAPATHASWCRRLPLSTQHPVLFAFWHLAPTFHPRDASA